MTLGGSRVDGHIDSLPLVHAWTNQGSKSNALSDVIKYVYETALKFNIALCLSYVPSKGNEADTPSRALSQNDCMLAIPVWKQLEARWGPHSVDLMSLDSNVQRGADDQLLAHFTLWPTKNSSGVNVFAQSLDPQTSVYSMMYSHAVFGGLSSQIAPMIPFSSDERTPKMCSSPHQPLKGSLPGHSAGTSGHSDF